MLKMGNYKVVRKLDRNKWDKFVLNNPNGNIFQTPEMFEVYKNTKNYEPVFLAVVNEKDEILGTLLAVIQKEYSGFFGNFTARSIIWGGPLVKDNDTEIYEILLKEYNQSIKGKSIYSQFRNFWEQGDNERIFDKCGFKYEEHLNILFDLNQPEDKLLKQMHKQRRHNVRRAQNKGVFFRELEINKEYEILYKLVNDTYKRVKLPVADKSLFNSAFNILYPKKMARYFGAIFKNKIIGVRIVLCYKDLVYDWYTGSSFADRNKYPNDFLPWQIILWGKKNGFRIFDFGGAGKPGVPYGVRDYKKKFGGKFVNFGRYEKIHKSFLMKIGKMGLKIWQKLK